MSKRYYNHIIYHKQCFDGFTSLFIAYLAGAINKDTNIYPYVPSATSVPAGISGKDVLIVDVAYKIEILREIIDVAKSVTFIDHHISIRDDVQRFIDENMAEYRKTKYIKIIYDEHMCGATLTWKFLFGDNTIPLFIKYIEDNDIGAWKYDKTKPFIFALQSSYVMTPSLPNLEHWKTLLNKYHVFKMYQDGLVISNYHNTILNDNSRRYSLELFPSEAIYKQFSDHFTKKGQYRVAVFCGMGCPSVTSMGMKLLETVDCDFVMIWTLNIDRKEYVVAMRSREVDISKIAKLFGGGGHKLAGAFSFSANTRNILDLFDNRSLSRITTK